MEKQVITLHTDHVKAIIDHVGVNFLDSILVSNEEIPENVQVFIQARNGFTG